MHFLFPRRNLILSAHKSITFCVFDDYPMKDNKTTFSYQVAFSVYQCLKPDAFFACLLQKT